MDINALLSPDETSSSPSSPSVPSPTSPSALQRHRQRAGGGKRTTSSLSQEILLSGSPDKARLTRDETFSSPVANGAMQHAASSPHGQQSASLSTPNFRPLPPTSNPAPPLEQYYVNAQQRPAVAHRPSSTPHMETLADLASMEKRHQTTRTISAESVLSHDHASQARHTLRNSNQLANVAASPIARNISRQSLADLTMAEAPAQTPPPRDFTSKAFSVMESQRVTELLGILAENSYAYDVHVELIDLLHNGFLAHVTPPAEEAGSAPQPHGEPQNYALLNDMRLAREAMDSRFAVGQDIWADWLADEILLARTTEERMALIELCEKAVNDEPASVRLWKIYADWFSTCHISCHDTESLDHSEWTAEDKETCKELFTKDTLLTILQKATDATRWRIDQSHVLWNRFIQVFQEQMPEAPTNNDVKQLYDLFFQRLSTPHSTWDETLQIFWPVISKYEGNNWEATIEQVNQAAEHAKIHIGIRQDAEFKLQRAIDSSDKDAIRHQFQKYLKDERFHHKRPGPFDSDLRRGLYERALLCEPTNTDWWLDYVDFLMIDPTYGSQPLLPLIERATRHCPWSGDLWARRILRADVEQLSRNDIESTKHRATNAGLLDVGGMEELVKMLQEWCSYLRRHAFRVTSTEDDLDTAEVGITMALEDVQEAGKKLYGQSFHGDPLFRLEQIQIKFYAEARRINEARDIYRQLASRHSGSFDFWSKYYNWELWLWGYDRIRESRRVETDDNGPVLATAVVEAALKQRDLDWPEKVLQLYLDHFQQHESGVKLQGALIEAREFANRLSARRAKEAEEAAAETTQMQEEYAAQAVEEAATGEKRKRDDEPSTNGDYHKKLKTELSTIEEQPSIEPSGSAGVQVKRDREHNTITVRNLPANVTDVDIKKFFRNCGKIPSIDIVQDREGNTASATVEFETHEDVLAAKTRHGKELNGQEIRIQGGALNTLYVANYPATYDEGAIRDLFKTYGDITSVRLPSLKYNSRRRFCYVQFLTADMARAAEDAMDGKKLDSVHTLVAKISDPGAKKQRSGPQNEGREIIIKNLDREATESDIRDIFGEYGQVERINILRLVNGKPTGTVFIIYSGSEEAEAAAEGANNKPFHDRIMKVEIAQPKGRAAPAERAKHEDVIVKRSSSAASPEPSGNGTRRESDVSMQSSIKAENTSYKTARERKIAVFNIPDTVNDARIRSVLEQYGPPVKIQLRREKRGAIVEMENVNDAFKIKMGVDVSALGSEAKTGDVGELMKVGNYRLERQARENDTAAPASEAASSSSKPATTFAPASIKHGGLGNRSGRRGGLGLKRGGSGSGFGSIARPTAGAASEAPTGTKKSNSDFRSMLEASKGQEKKEKKGEDSAGTT